MEGNVARARVPWNAQSDLLEDESAIEVVDFGAQPHHRLNEDSSLELMRAYPARTEPAHVCLHGELAGRRDIEALVVANGGDETVADQPSRRRVGRVVDEHPRAAVVEALEGVERRPGAERVERGADGRRQRVGPGRIEPSGDAVAGGAARAETAAVRRRIGLLEAARFQEESVQLMSRAHLGVDLDESRVVPASIVERLPPGNRRSEVVQLGRGA